MAQQIVVSVLKKQIESKKKALETALEKSKTLSAKREADEKKAREAFDKELAAWEEALVALAISKTSKDNTLVQNHSWRDEKKVTVTVTLTGKMPKRPEHKQIKWADYHVEIPTYYDAHHRPICSDAVLSHWAKALEMLEVLPTGTVEIQVKDFNFLTKF